MMCELVSPHLQACQTVGIPVVGWVGTLSNTFYTSEGIEAKLEDGRTINGGPFFHDTTVLCYTYIWKTADMAFFSLKCSDRSNLTEEFCKIHKYGTLCMYMTFNTFFYRFIILYGYTWDQTKCPGVLIFRESFVCLNTWLGY